MRAVRIHSHGEADVLELEELAVPEPGPDDLLVRVAATTISHRDIWMRRGHPHPAYRVTLPGILGVDVSGDVVDVGERVSGFAAGDRVTANPYIPCGSCSRCLRGATQNCMQFAVYNGSYAEYTLVKAAQAVKLAPGVPYEPASTFHNYVTAWQMLISKSGLSPADTVFVWAGTSGLGSAAIEIARLAGARVITSAGTADKRELLAGRGSDVVLDHHAPDLVEGVLEATDGDGADIVFEHIGQASWERSMQLCAPGGTIVSAGATSGDDAQMDITYMFAKQLRILGSRLGTMEDAFAVAAQISAGHLQPLIDSEIPLERIADGHRRLEEGDATGRILVRMAS